ncbi:MAG: hypothetical protein D6771_05215 [Zetaproteobacteria bacterium]|nr:MAG: hypothetical protein D6771_05215 [Zetaproteobacteria bacterium]
MKRWGAWALAAMLGLGTTAWAADDASLSLPDEGEFHESWFTANKLHMYLGLGSLLAGAIAGATAPEAPEGVAVPPSQRKSATNTTHHYAAKAAVGLGAAAVLTGLVLHWDDLVNGEGLLDPDRMHAILGTLATVGFALTLSKGPKRIGDPSNGHSTLGFLGGALMLGAIAYEW